MTVPLINKSEVKTMAKKKQTFLQMLRGADDIYLTDKSIAVTRVATGYDKRGQYTITETRKYVPRTEKTMSILSKEVGRVRKGK